MSNPKKLTKKQREEIAGAVMENGFEFFFLHSVEEDEFEGTELETPVKQFREAYDKLADILGIEVSKEEDESDDDDEDNDDEDDDDYNEDI